MKFLRFIVTRSGAARRRLIASLAAGAVSGVASVGLLALVHQSLEGAEEPARMLGVAFAGLIVLVSAVRLLSVWLLAQLGQGMVKDLRLELSRRVLSSPLARLERLGAPKLLATLTDDINAMTQALVFVPAVCINGTIVVGALGYLAWLHPRMFLLLLAAVVVGMVTYYLPAQLGMARFRAARRQEDVLFGHFRALSQGIKELKLHRRRRGAFDGELTATAERMRSLRVGAATLYGAAASWGHLLFFVVIGVLLFLRPGFLEVGRGTLVGYTVVLLYLMTPLQTLLDTFPMLGRADVAVERVQELGLELGAPVEPAADPAAAPAVVPGGFSSLELVGVTHTYRREGSDHEFTLGPVDLALAPGDLVFLIGGNGSGKTTLAKILLGLYPPEAGEIRLDGRPVPAAELDSYRQLFSAVFADFFLFETLLGLEHPELDEKARRYLAELELAHKVRVEGGALSTTELSQGQRKRLALLTAYLEDRPIYLFDEWAADQDPVFKELFYRQILPDLSARGKAVVVISHDDRYFDVAHRVLKLEDGKLAARAETGAPA